MNKRLGWKCILNKAVSGQTIGRDVYVKQKHAPIYEKLKRDMQANFHLVTLFRAINDLNATPLRGDSIVPAGNIRHLEIKDVRLEYFLEGGDVLINKMEFGSQFNEPSGDQETAVYQVKRGVDKWVLGEDSPKKGALSLSTKWDGTHYAAVSGKMANKERAGRMLGDHITSAYLKQGELSKKDVNDAQKVGSQYSLFWINNEHKSLNAKNGLSSLIQQAAKAKQPVNWLVHGEGAATLEASLAILKDAPSLSRFAAQDEEIVRHLMHSMSLQKFYLSNPKGADIKNIAKLAQKVGVTFDETMVNANNRDLTNANTYRNLQGEIAKTGAKAAAGAGTLSVIGLDAVTKNYEKVMGAVESAIRNPTAAGITAAAGITVGAFFAFKTALKKQTTRFQGTRAALASTFGDGNDYWYTSDADLIKQLKA